MSYECFEVQESAGVAHVRLNRGDQANSMIPAFWEELPDIVGSLSDSGRVRVMVLSAAGRHFCSGMDLSVFSGDREPGAASHSRAPSGAKVEAGRRRVNVRHNILHLQRSFTALEEARMPVLAAIQGACIGGAVDMVTAADCRYATTDAWFCIQETNIGLAADVGTLQRLPKLIPEGVAREYAYTGARLSAARAKEVGLVNEVYEDHDAMMEAVNAIAEQIAARSPLVVHGVKEALLYSRDHTVSDSLNQIATWQSGMLWPAEMAEAFAATSERRPPQFQDLPPAQRGL